MAAERPFRQYRCSYSATIYDEALGMPEDGLPPGTRWEDVPDDWYCRQCGTDKAGFTLIED